MAKSLPKTSNGTTPAPEEASASKTPAGVWVIVGMAVFFVIAGLGISAFVVWKSIASNNGSGRECRCHERATTRFRVRPVCRTEKWAWNIRAQIRLSKMPARCRR